MSAAVSAKRVPLARSTYELRLIIAPVRIHWGFCDA